MKYTIYILLIIFTVFTTAQTQQDEIKKRQTELNKIRNEIEGWEKKIQQGEKQEKSTLEILDSFDKQLTLLRNLTNKLREEEVGSEKRINVMRKSIGVLEEQLYFIKKQYSKFVLNAYKQGRTQDLELLASSKSANQLVVRSTYMKKFSEYRQRDIETITAKYKDLEKQKIQLVNQLLDNRSLLASKREEEEKIIEKTKERKKVLESIKQDKKNYAKEIERKKKSVQDLESMISKLIESDRKKSERKTQANDSPDISTSYSSTGGGNFLNRRGTLPWPVRKGKLLNKFGENQHPVLKTISQNTGIDISVPAGTDVYSVSEGEVATIWWLPSFGNLVIVNHNNGYRTVYAHLSEIEVSEGQKVSEGTRIGKSGETINGPLVHFEVWKDREKQNPELWLHPQGVSKK
ncbi:MAG: peptidoglycan DD-metalloendopeptidase family protein [Bacteroidota bacterium]|nr:peptidoglycan DD-metalloendopeptidase family protein [Bacteroidota bacterium]